MVSVNPKSSFKLQILAQNTISQEKDNRLATLKTRRAELIDLIQQAVDLKCHRERGQTFAEMKKLAALQAKDAKKARDSINKVLDANADMTQKIEDQMSLESASSKVQPSKCHGVGHSYIEVFFLTAVLRNPPHQPEHLNSSSRHQPNTASLGRGMSREKSFTDLLRNQQTSRSHLDQNHQARARHEGLPRPQESSTTGQSSHPVMNGGGGQPSRPLTGWLSKVPPAPMGTRPTAGREGS